MARVLLRGMAPARLRTMARAPYHEVQNNSICVFSDRRQCTKGLDRKQVIELARGWEHAARIGRPLNALVTIRPFEEYDPATICKIAASIRNALGVYARQHGFPFVAAWTRECNPDGTGPWAQGASAHAPSRVGLGGASEKDHLMLVRPSGGDVGRTAVPAGRPQRTVADRIAHG
jgi:hypothetical protein